MARKITGCFTLLFFIWFEIACVIYEKNKITVEQAVGSNTEVLAVAKKSGEYFEFPKHAPGRIVGDSVVSPYLKSDFVIDLADVEKKEMEINGRDQTTTITTKDGKTIKLKLAYEKDGKIYGQTMTSIPLSQVEMLWVRKVNGPLTFLASASAIIGVAAGIYAGLYLIWILTKESCPFIYSFDGERYVFDAEPYGGAICEGLKRTEWCELENLKEVDGRYKLRLTNEVDETQYTDELTLVAVDHPAEILVVPDEKGTFHRLAKPAPPVRAYDQNGRDISPQVQKKDWIYWKTPEDEISSSRNSWKDELVFEFPKPEGAKKVKFLFNGCNTLWGSQMIKRLLELNGTGVQEFYREVNASGPAFFQRQQWTLREELFRLQVRVETAGQWKSKGLLLGGGPFISEDRVYILDVGDVPGDVLKIKLTPPVGFWMINRVAVDYSDDLTVVGTEIAAAEASDHQGRDIREALSLTDGRYFAMPRTGDWAEISFIAPPRKAGGERSIFARVSGYYDIHLKAQGEPQTELLENFRTKPGSVIQYACREYQKWKSEMGSGAAAR
jgi:hypothetical protein